MNSSSCVTPQNLDVRKSLTLRNSELSEEPFQQVPGESPRFPSCSPPSAQGCRRGAGTGLSLGCPSTQTLLPHQEPAPAENSCVKRNRGANLADPWSSKQQMCDWWQLRGEQNLLVATVWGWHKAVVETLLETKSLTGGSFAAVCTKPPLKFSCLLSTGQCQVSLDDPRAEICSLSKRLIEIFCEAVLLSEGPFFVTCDTDHSLGSDGLSVISSNL